MARDNTKNDTAAWNQFCDALTAVLAKLEEDQVLILITKRTNYYVQFAGLGEDGMLIEAQSNYFIEQDDLKLSANAQEHLLAVGWNAPTFAPSDEDEEDKQDGSSNYHLIFDVPVTCRTLAGLAIETLQQIYKVRHPDDLKYSAFAFEGDSLHFPRLGIKRGRD
jgi:hypothetical protein